MYKINNTPTRLAHTLQVPIEDVEAVIYGEHPISNPDNYKPIMQEIVKDGRGIFLCAIWKSDEVTPRYFQQATPIYDYIGQIIEGIVVSLYNSGYVAQVLICNPDIADQAYFERIINYRPDVALINLAHYSPHLQLACDKLARPCIYLDFPYGENPEERYIVTIKGKQAMHDLVVHLYLLGHRRIGFVQGPQVLQSDVERYQGYVSGLNAMQLPFDKSLVGCGNWLEDGGQHVAEQLLALDNPPTAIMASNDRMALGVVQAIKAKGLKVPFDISVSGFDDEPHATLYQPHLTTVRVHVTKIGETAADYATKLLQGYLPQPAHYYLPIEIVKRESTFVAKRR